MPDGVEFKISGLDELLAKFEAVADDVKQKGGRFALRKAANLVAEKAKQNALTIDDPETAEQIAKNIAVRFSSRLLKRTGNLGFRVGVLGGARATGRAKAKTERRRARLGQQSLESLGEFAGAGKNNPGGDTFHWRFVEFGTERTRAQPFMQKSLSENTGAATNEFVNQFSRSIDRAIKRANKKPKRGR